MSTPSRPLASTALWGQLLRKNTLAAPSAAVPLPPTAPLDKTGTSMRILLHDTQANFEKFSTKIDALTSDIDDAKRELILVKDLFQREHETLTTDIVDLVNRSQTQIQKSLGDPAQATNLESFRKDVDSRLDGLCKRIDDIQSFNQTQSQALQNVSQALLSLQDQQGKILAALLPLQPLLQAVPVHINSARSSINETVLKVSIESNRVHRTPPHIWSQGPQVMRNKRSFPSGPPSSPLSRKRPRLDSERLDSDHVPPIEAHPRGGVLSPRPPSRRQTFSTNDGPYFALSCQPSSRAPQVYRTPSLAKPHRDPAAPRRPLGDLPLPPQISGLDKEDVSHSRFSDFAKGRKNAFSPPAHRTPLIPRSLLRTLPQTDASVPRTPPFLGGNSKGMLPSEPATPLRPATPPPASSPSPVPPSTLLGVSLPPANSTITDARPNLAALASLEPPPLTVRNIAVVQQQNAPVAGKATTVRVRRSPFRDGRRFIPLDDDDSDSDED